MIPEADPEVVGREVAARLFPENPPLFGPTTRHVLIRVAMVWWAIWVLGALLISVGGPQAQVVGAGLLLPGAGFISHGHWPLAVVAIAALGLSVLIWWMIGAVVLPVGVWTAAVLLPLWHDHLHAGGWTTPHVVAACVVPGVVALLLVIHTVRHRIRTRRAVVLNTELRSVRFVETALPSSEVLPVAEASEDDLARLRFALDLALQPIAEFAGFDDRDQFREAALRYQLCILGYALSVYRYTHTPAFAGYLTEAQHRAIIKMGDRRVWGYWALENAWGRMSLKRDPVDNADNVMLTGWQGAAVGMFETLEDDRFSRPGALRYAWSDNEHYDYDFGALAESIVRNMRRSPYTLFSCEPRWIYPVCNTFAANTLLMHDRLRGSRYFAEVEHDLGRAYREEFHRPDGKMIGVRSETLGLSWHLWSSEGVQMPTTYWMHSFMPDLALRSWWMMRDKVLRRDGDRFLLPPTPANRCDAGSYAFGRQSFAQVFLAMAAREVGDEEVATAALRYVEEMETTRRSNGVARYAVLSTQGNLYSLMARFGRRSGMRDLIGFGLPEVWKKGPRIAAAAYPDVLVAHAVSDGAALDAVLYPGAGPVRATLVLDRLVPDRLYRTLGTTETAVRADGSGRATVQVDTGTRTPIRVEPRA
ncbi:linalool dehydratase/isomerase domain-containing protein [Nocardia kruczakiae]|uniref:linalool dehydratase/isomerase domain-containing protein n=1 Tax=Nocardia kruczakiae TaxID=261477 RepID=UPI0007A53B85|nr:hypothetical protein [Nocardia kruczakiae]